MGIRMVGGVCVWVGVGREACKGEVLGVFHQF